MTQSPDWNNLLAALESDPNLREALRRHVLTEELLNLPATVANLTKHTESLTERVESLAERVESLTAHVESLTERVESLTAHVETIAQAVAQLQADMASVKNGIGEVQRVQTIQSGVFSEAAGVAYENNAIRLAPRLFRRRMGLAETALFSHYSEGRHGKLKAMAETGLGTQGVTSEEVEDLLETDMVFTGKAPNGDVFIVVEASLTVQANDVIRAKRRAGILDRIAGLEGPNPATVAVVMGKAISEDAQALLFGQGDETGTVTFLMANADAPDA